MRFPKAKDTERVGAEKWIDVDFAGRIDIFARPEFPNADNRRREFRGCRWRRTFLHLTSLVRRPSGAGMRKVAAHRNTKTATAPIHSQKPRCQNTERRSACLIGCENLG